MLPFQGVKKDPMVGAGVTNSTVGGAPTGDITEKTAGSMGTYAGDVLPAEAWGVLKDDPASARIDVRRGAEWSFVSVPTLSDVDKPVYLFTRLQQ